MRRRRAPWHLVGLFGAAIVAGGLVGVWLADDGPGRARDRREPDGEAAAPLVEAVADTPDIARPPRPGLPPWYDPTAGAAPDATPRAPPGPEDRARRLYADLWRGHVHQGLSGLREIALTAPTATARDACMLALTYLYRRASDAEISEWVAIDRAFERNPRFPSSHERTIDVIAAASGNPFARHGPRASMCKGETRHYRLGTDLAFDARAPSRDGFDDVAAFLERAHAQILASLRLPDLGPDTTRVYVFARKHDFQRFCDSIDVRADIQGIYVPELRLVAVDGSGGAWRQTLAHELTHAILAAALARPAPTWFDEGIATYMGASEPEPGAEGLRLGLIPPSRGAGRNLAADMALVWDAEIAKGKPPAIRLESLVRARYREFHARDRDLERRHYDEAWSFVHFLAHGFATGPALLHRYLDALRGGAGADVAFARAFAGVRWDALEEEWRRYVRALAVDPAAPPTAVGDASCPPEDG